MTAQNTTTETPSRTTRLLRRLVLLTIAVLTATPALAQVEPIEPVWMVVTRDTPMRCGDEPTFYKVATLKRGDVVRMDAKNIRYGRVIYPPNMFAYVARNDAKVISDTELKLASKDSKIRSPNAISGLAGSWRSLYLGDIKPDATLKIIAPVKTPSGQITGYRIVPPVPKVAPHPPYGYVELSAMREATPDEVKAYLESLKPQPKKPDAATHKDEPPHAEAPGKQETGIPAKTEAEKTQPVSEEMPAESPRAEKPEPKTTNAENPEKDDGAEKPNTSLLQEIVMPGDEAPAPEAAPEATAEDKTPEKSEASNEETTTTQAPPAKQPEQPKRDWLNWNELESELTHARAAGRETLEDSLDELIAEYERSLSHAQTEPMRRALNSRLDWLRLRKTARDERLALDAALAQSQELREKSQQRIRTWQSARYDIVGRLALSTVYDGRRLPRMYRIRAAGETGIVRTIGYIRDVPALDLASKLGRIVGVVGEARLDEALHLRIITPQRIDILKPDEADSKPAPAPGG